MASSGWKPSPTVLDGCISTCSTPLAPKTPHGPGQGQRFHYGTGRTHPFDVQARALRGRRRRVQRCDLQHLASLGRLSGRRGRTDAVVHARGRRVGGRQATPTGFGGRGTTEGANARIGRACAHCHHAPGSDGAPSNHRDDLARGALDAGRPARSGGNDTRGSLGGGAPRQRGGKCRQACRGTSAVRGRCGYPGLHGRYARRRGREFGRRPRQQPLGAARILGLLVWSRAASRSRT